MKIKTLVKRWGEARLLGRDPEELAKEIQEQVDEELHQIRNMVQAGLLSSPFSECGRRFNELVEALRPMAEHWLYLQLQEKAGLRKEGSFPQLEENHGATAAEILPPFRV